MYQVMYDENTYLVGDIKEEDASFDYEYHGIKGIQYETSYDVTDFCIVYWKGDRKRDVTNLIVKHHPKLYSEFQEYFLNKVVDNL